MARELCEDKSRDMAFCYSDVSSSHPTTIQTHLVNQIQASFDQPNPSEMFNLTTGMEMIGFSKNLQQQQHHHHQQQSDNNSNSVLWKSSLFNNKADFTTGISETSTENLIVGHPDSSSAWQENRLLVDDSSLRCVFPCEANERPSQGLSLSLSSSNPSTVGLQSFELRHQENPSQQEMRFMNSSSRDGFFGKSSSLQHQQQQMIQGQFQLRNSRYWAPAQELLNEFCSLGTKQIERVKQKAKQKQCLEEENGSSSSSSKKQSLYSLEFMDLQRRKTKLLSMLEEVDRRYRHYCDQMKAVVSTFEAVAGAGAATVYSALASKAMSRHFRCLRDGIVAQIHATKKAMGEKDPVAPGTTRGETPRLRILDQALRRQRAFQQMSMMESHPWRPQRGLPERSVSVLRAWLFEHFLHPYPSDVDKHILARQTGLSRSQVSNWFINARVRLWKPMVEDMYVEELKDVDNNMASSDGVTDLEDNNNNNNNGSCRPSNQNPSSNLDQKPTQDQLIPIDSECLSSIISNSDKNNDTNNLGTAANITKTFQSHHHLPPHNFGAFGAMELDFSSYNHHHAAAGASGVSYASEHTQNFNGGGAGGVSLTLGLQQHGGSGVSLAFSPASQSSLFYSRDHMEDCQPVQYSLLDGEGQNLPYRNLMGAQLLRDLAG